MAAASVDISAPSISGLYSVSFCPSRVSIIHFDKNLIQREEKFVCVLLHCVVSFYIVLCFDFYFLFCFNLNMSESFYFYKVDFFLLFLASEWR